MTKKETAVTWMIETANNKSHGYDQRYRWGERGDYDCASAVITAWESAGVPVKSAGATYCGNMYSAFRKCRFKDATKTVNLITGSGLKRGDVLLNPHHHTAMYIGNGQIVQASINERGTVTGGTPGDQTGREFYIRSYYNFPWTYVLRYVEKRKTTSKKQNTKTGSKKTNSEIAHEVIRGLWGNGSDRTRRLRKAGYDPIVIQCIVNTLISNK